MIQSGYIKVFWFVFLRVFDTDVFELKAPGFRSGCLESFKASTLGVFIRFSSLKPTARVVLTLS